MSEKEIIEFINSLEGKEKTTDKENKKLFNINNFLYPDLKEVGTWCGSCTTRVYNRLKKWRDMQNEK